MYFLNLGFSEWPVAIGGVLQTFKPRPCSTGAVIYVCYGYSHSVEAARPKRDGNTAEFVMYRSPPMKQKVAKPQPGEELY